MTDDFIKCYIEGFEAKLLMLDGIDCSFRGYELYDTNNNNISKCMYSLKKGRQVKTKF
jgi:hypothetical protein